MTSTPGDTARPPSADRPRASAGELGSVAAIRKRLATAGLATERASLISEGDLILANVPRRLRVEDCVCGGQVAATDGDWDDITVAIGTHAGGARHQAWRAENHV